MLSGLQLGGLVESDPVPGRSWTVPRLTEDGQKRAKTDFQKLPDRYQRYVSEVAEYVRRLSFAQLVSAIYKQYPEMKENSVFRE